MTREFSAGGVVFNNQGQVLLIKNMGLKDPTKSYWGFPKGHIEIGESAKAAAVREVQEETGLNVEIVQKIEDSKYVYTNKSAEKIFKVVSFFLMKYLSGEIKIQTTEIMAAEFLDPEEALSKISFPNDKKILQQAIKTINKNSA